MCGGQRLALGVWRNGWSSSLPAKDIGQADFLKIRRNRELRIIECILLHINQRGCDFRAARGGMLGSRSLMRLGHGDSRSNRETWEIAVIGGFHIRRVPHFRL